MADAVKIALEILGGHILWRAIIVPFIARRLSDETKELYHKARTHFGQHKGALNACDMC